VKGAPDRPAQRHARPRVLLFDIDGTLIHKGGMGSAALRRAFAEVHGIEDPLSGIRLDGKTDPTICREVFERHSLAWSDYAWQRIQEAYVRCLEQEAAERPCGQLCPGVWELLDCLATRQDCAVGLLTGNVRRGAEIKLRVFGLWDYFAFGAFGCDRDRRPELVGVALDRAAQSFGAGFLPSDAFVIGDTPADIETARLGGCASLAVATGRYSDAELRAHGADWVLEDLSDLGSVLGILALAPSGISII
jgi:phosphoglycolate phosphatase-like HAD superfamily hydrolase